MSDTKKRGPESQTWDTFKGRQCLIKHCDGTNSNGILAWVDRYTIGVRDIPGIREFIGKNALVIIYKSNIRWIAAMPSTTSVDG